MLPPRLSPIDPTTHPYLGNVLPSPPTSSSSSSSLVSSPSTSSSSSKFHRKKRRQVDDDPVDGGDSDEDYVEKRKSKGSKVNQQAKIKQGTRRTYKDSSGNDVLEYDTEGGAHHVETTDPATGRSTTVTTGLTPAPTGTRAPTKPKGQGYVVDNPYGLSVGQRTRNAPVASHRTPSFLGMGAGGEYGNVDSTSGRYNSGSVIGSFETAVRDRIEGRPGPFTMTTETQTERLADNPREDEISRLKGLRGHWKKPGRIKKRIDKLVRQNPDLTRVVSSSRSVTDGKTKKAIKSNTFGTDLHYGLPARAYDENADAEFRKRTNGASSSEEDNELDVKVRKKKGASKKSTAKRKKKSRKKDDDGDGSPRGLPPPPPW
jgi:hypothetical protein